MAVMAHGFPMEQSVNNSSGAPLPRNMHSLGPVTNGKFPFSVDSFYAESSGHHLHRRATLEDLKRLFDTTSTSADGSKKSDHVGHWYEAQLLHYGLAPSKNKAVAKMRLLDALKAGSLAVPKEILKIEADLKKEWRKRDKEARAGSSAANDATPKGKRKRDESEKTAGEEAGQSTAKGAKKAKPAAGTATAKNSAKSNAGSKTKSQSTSATQKKSTETSEAGSNTAPKPRAKRGGATAGARAHTNTDQATNSPPRRLKQTARRSRPFSFVGGRRPAPSRESEQTAIQTNPPSYNSLYQTDGQHPLDDAGDPMDIDEPSDVDGYSHSFASNSNRSSPSPDPDGFHLRPLGLINGVYEIDSHDLNEWPEYAPPEGFTLTLALAGSSLWGEYDFGMFHGIMWFPDRPWGSSLEEIPFKWRGRELGEGEMSFGPRNQGWIRFLGGGEIEGQINCYGSAKFWGRRISGQETQPPRDVRSMRDEWDSYNEREYERERVDRWR